MTKATQRRWPWRHGSRRDGGGRPASMPRLLGVLLCYNDGDLVEEAVRYLREQGHDVVVWDHGSTDETPDVLRSLQGDLVELTTVPAAWTSTTCTKPCRKTCWTITSTVTTGCPGRTRTSSSRPGPEPLVPGLAVRSGFVAL